jgi:hypothetical protein
MNLDALSMTTIRYAAHILAIIFGAASVSMLWASLYYPEAAGKALIYFILATGIERIRPKN